MAVSFKVSPKKFFQANGLSTALEQLAAKGVSVVVTPSKLRFSKDGEVVGSIPIPKADVVAAKKLDAQTYGTLVKTIEKALWNAGQKESLDLPQFDPNGAVPIPAKPAAQDHQASGVFPEGQMLTEEPVPLRDATQLYQPVRGTSEGSRYFLVASRADLKVAARYRANRLSLRIEGEEFKTYVENLKECGFTNINLGGNKPYASMHLDIDDPVLAKKALGAVVTGLGVDMDTPLPNLSKIANKGK
jgi:hypothetical protein